MNPAKQIAQIILELLKRRNLSHLLPDVIEELNNAIEGEEKVQVVIEAAQPMKEETLAGLVDIIASKLGFEPNVRFELNPKLMGGIRVIIDDQLIDATLKAQIESLFNKIH